MYHLYLLIFVLIVSGFIFTDALAASEITIKVVNGASNPGCDTSGGCYLPLVGTVDAGGRVIFSNTDTAAHTFTSGTPSDGPSGIFDSGLVMAGATFETTMTKEGIIQYFCMVHPWMDGIIYVGQSPYPVPTPEPNPIKLNIFTDSQVYDLGNTVNLKVKLDGASSSHTVGIDVSDNTGKTVISRSINTLLDEPQSITFKITENFKTGNYLAVATTSVNGKTLKESTSFVVKSQYNQFKITSVQSTNQQGKPTPLKAGELGFIKIQLESNKSIASLVTVNLFDSDLTSIGIGSVKTTLSSGNSEFILSFMIPSDAALGPADIYVNAFSDWPSNGGVPLTKEFAVSEPIGSSESLSSQNPKSTVEESSMKTESTEPNTNLVSPKTTTETQPKTITEQKTSTGTPISVKTDELSYNEGNIIVISGKIKEPLSDSKVTLQVFFEGNLIDISQVDVKKDGVFSNMIIAQGPLWKDNGLYTLKASYLEGIATETSFNFLKSQPKEIKQTYEVNAGTSGIFDVDYSIIGGSIQKIIVDKENFGIIISINSSDDGNITLKLPRASIDAKTQSGVDDAFIILIDGVEVPYQETVTNSDSRTISINFQQGDHDVRILGTFVI